MGDFDSFRRSVRHDLIRGALIAVGIAAVLVMVFFAGRASAAPLTVVPPCKDWRVSSLAAGGGKLYCGSIGVDQPWLTLAAGCTWKASRDSRRTALEPTGRLVLTCTSGDCAGMAVAIYPTPI